MMIRFHVPGLSRRTGMLLALSAGWLITPLFAQESGSTEKRFQDLLRLANGDQLAGEILTADPESGVAWRHDSKVAPANFKYSAVGEIELEAVEPPVKPSWRRSLIRLSNGDQLAGRLRKVTATNAVFQTWYGGDLTFLRDRWQWIIFDDETAEPLFAGLKGAEGWTLGDVSMARVQSGDWVYNAGAFYATKAASIARNLNLPDRAQIQFDLHWKGTLNLAFALYTDYLHPVNLTNKDTEPDFGGFYSLQLNSYFANVLMVKQKVPLQYLGQVEVPVFAKKRKANIDIRVDKTGGSIALLVDGELVKQWVDKTGFAGEGAGVRMVHQGQGAIRFSNFRVMAWNGQFDEPPTIRATAEEDLVTLRNGDKLIGKVRSISEDMIDLELIGGNIEMPLREVKKIEFAGVADSKMALPEGGESVTGDFSDRGIVHLNLLELRDERLRGTSPNLGSVDFRLRAFKRLVLGNQ
ncbi:MAG: hypothetical protein M2R45_03596 [Verrucomicrobia subdivision 3 bacterium]|nr:hypothetical protein [Limisphaerales bacterium]MCS1414772.1 hypothetical protein [Limisphaerales bacterium]